MEYKAANRKFDMIFYWYVHAKYMKVKNRVIKP